MPSPSTAAGGKSPTPRSPSSSASSSGGNFPALHQSPSDPAERARDSSPGRNRLPLGTSTHGKALHASRRHPHRDAQRARLRGMPQDRRLVGPPPPLPHLRPCRLLRRFPEPACHQALSRDAAPDRRGLRSAGGLGLVLRRRGPLRPVGSSHAAAMA